MFNVVTLLLWANSSTVDSYLDTFIMIRDSTCAPQPDLSCDVQSELSHVISFILFHV
jgi:hypothetical protein